MEFLKRHYEKLILLILLLVFILSMIYVLRIIQQTGEITEASLQIPTREADVKKEDPKAPYFNVAKIYEGTALRWVANGPREKGSSPKASSDLVQAFEMARCPNANCKMIIPREIFSGQKCPFCGLELPTPNVKEEQRPVGSAGDLDGDGLGNDEETKFGLDPRNPYDARLDNDGDGFSNIFEIKNNFDPNNVHNHPPFWFRLYLREIARVPLPISFKSLNTNGTEDQSKWLFQINRTRRNRPDATELLGLGETLFLGENMTGKEYKIVKVVLKRTETPSKNKDGSPVYDDKSELYLEEVGGNDKITMVINKTVYSSDKKAILIDTGDDNAELYVDVNDEFRLDAIDRRLRPRSESYRVKAIDPEAKTVLLEDPSKFEGDTTVDKLNNKMLIDVNGKVPEDMRIKVVEGGGFPMGMPGEYPGAMPVVPRGRGR